MTMISFHDIWTFCGSWYFWLTFHQNVSSYGFLIVNLMTFLLLLWLLFFILLHELLLLILFTKIGVLDSNFGSHLFLSFTFYPGDFIHYYNFSYHLCTQNCKFHIFSTDISDDFQTHISICFLDSSYCIT